MVSLFTMQATDHSEPGREIARSGSIPRIIVDTREQAPYFSDSAVPTVKRGLKSGDYSLDGFEDRVAIERKSLPDLYGCIGKGRERFERELVRLSEMDFAAIVVEASLRDVLEGFERSKVHPRSAVGSLFSWEAKYGVHIVFAGDRRLGMAATKKLLEKWWKHKAKTSDQPG